jgi:sorbitol-specific phosphotransferase system component IIC
MKRATANEVTGIIFLFLVVFVLAGAILAFVNNHRIDQLKGMIQVQEAGQVMT